MPVSRRAVLGRQYVEGQKLEPGDRQDLRTEGLGSLDLRQLEEQARDPLRTNAVDGATWNFGRLNPFGNGRDDSNNNNERNE